jgi:hypothetical protein
MSRLIDSVIKAGKLIVVLERIARRDHPPQLIKLQASERDFGDQHMALMRRVEGSAEQADGHALLDMRHFQKGRK